MTNNSGNNYTGGHGCVAWLNAKGDVIREAKVQAASVTPGYSRRDDRQCDDDDDAERHEGDHQDRVHSSLPSKLTVAG